MRQVVQRGWRTNEPGDFPHVLNENIFKMSVDLLIENNYSKRDILDIFSKSSISLFGSEIEEILNLPIGYLSEDENRDSKVIKLKINDDN